MNNILPDITTEKMAKLAEGLEKQVRRLALQHDTVIYYSENGVFMEEKPGRYKRVVEEKKVPNAS